MIRILKLFVLTVSGLVGLGLGTGLGPMEIGVYDADIRCTYNCTEAIRRVQFFEMGFFCAAAVFACAKFIRFPTVVSLIMVFVLSFIYPLLEIVRNGALFYLNAYAGIPWFLVPYFVGMFAAFGIMSVFSEIVLPMFGRSKR